MVTIAVTTLLLRMNGYTPFPTTEYMFVKSYLFDYNFSCDISELKMINTQSVFAISKPLDVVSVRFSNMNNETGTFSASQMLEYLRYYSGYDSVLEKKDKGTSYLQKN